MLDLLLLQTQIYLYILYKNGSTEFINVDMHDSINENMAREKDYRDRKIKQKKKINKMTSLKSL